jgi:hypothetical protein
LPETVSGVAVVNKAPDNRTVTKSIFIFWPKKTLEKHLSHPRVNLAASLAPIKSLLAATTRWEITYKETFEAHKHKKVFTLKKL